MMLTTPRCHCRTPLLGTTIGPVLGSGFEFSCNTIGPVLCVFLAYERMPVVFGVGAPAVFGVAAPVGAIRLRIARNLNSVHPSTGVACEVHEEPQPGVNVPALDGARHEGLP